MTRPANLTVGSIRAATHRKNSMARPRLPILKGSSPWKPTQACLQNQWVYNVCQPSNECCCHPPAATRVSRLGLDF